MPDRPAQRDAAAGNRYFWLVSTKVQYNLDIMQPRQTLTTIVTSILEKLEPILIEERPDILLVHGDTSTTFAAALAAFYQKIPVGHVEAGLRTFDKYSPFPEEINRCLTGRSLLWHVERVEPGCVSSRI